MLYNRCDIYINIYKYIYPQGTITHYTRYWDFLYNIFGKYRGCCTIFCYVPLCVAYMIRNCSIYIRWKYKPVADISSVIFSEAIQHVIQPIFCYFSTFCCLNNRSRPLLGNLGLYVTRFLVLCRYQKAIQLVTVI